MTIQYDPQQVTDWLTPLEKVYARQSAQLDRYHDQLRERDRQEEEATLDIPEMFAKLASFSQSIASVVEARETGGKKKAAESYQKRTSTMTAEEKTAYDDIVLDYKKEKNSLNKWSENLEKAARESGKLDRIVKEELFARSPRMQLFERELIAKQRANQLPSLVEQLKKDPKYNKRWSDYLDDPTLLANLRQEMVNDISKDWRNSDGLHYSGVEQSINKYLDTKIETDKFKYNEIVATKKESNLYDIVNDSIDAETRGVHISSTVKNNTIYSDPDLPLHERRQAWDSFFLSTDRGIRSGVIKLTQDQLLDTPIERDDGAIVPLSEFATPEDLKTINNAYNTFNTEQYERAQAVTKVEIQTAFNEYKKTGNEANRKNALNKYLRNGGKTSDAEYKALENAKKADPAIAKIEQERVGEIQLTGRPGQYEDEVENMSQVDFDKWKNEKDLYEANREQNGLDKKTSDTYATNLIKADLGFDLSPMGKGIQPGPQTEIRDWISARRDQIYATVYNDPTQDRKTIGKTTDTLLKDELTSLGFYAPNDPEHPDYGILTSNNQSEYPGWVAKQQSKIEQSKGSNPQRTVRNLLAEFQEHKTRANVLANGKGITNAELLAVIDNIKNGKLTEFPPDVLLKSRILAEQPSKLVLSKLEYLANSKKDEDVNFVARFNIDTKALPRTFENNADIKMREIIEGVNDGRTLLSKYNNLGIESFTPKELNFIIKRNEEERAAAQKEKEEKEELEEEIKETRKMQTPDTQIGRYNTRS